MYVYIQTEITATSYAVIFMFNLSTISMSKDTEHRNGTLLQAQGVVNNAVSIKHYPSRSF